MDFYEATQWLLGNRSTINSVPQDPIETWQSRIAIADAANTQQAYYIVKAHKEGLVS